MYRDTFKLTYAFDKDFVILNWKRITPEPGDILTSRYPELEMRINYRDISKDTVVAMLRDLDVPDRVSKSILTYIAANAA